MIHSRHYADIAGTSDALGTDSHAVGAAATSVGGWPPTGA